MQGGSAVVWRSDVGWVVVGDGRGLRSGGRRSVREEGSVRVRRAERLETDPAHSQTGCAVLCCCWLPLTSLSGSAAQRTG
jgi:hypothetical protein